jgi:hypothetical protein
MEKNRIETVVNGGYARMNTDLEVGEMRYVY